MDRDAIDKVSVTYDEIISALNNQIGQLNSELIASKIMIQKLQQIIEDIDQSNKDEDSKTIIK